MAKTKVKVDTSYICPIIRNNGEKHVLEQLLESDGDMPEITTVGCFKTHPNKNHSWVSVKMITKGDKVLKMEVGEPDMKAIAEESAKIAFVETFADLES